MNLDDLAVFQRLDTQAMITEINHLPQQLTAAWTLGQTLPLPEAAGVQSIIIVGMGGSAIGADLLAAYAAPDCRVPILVQRGYGLPAWASGPETLVIAVSHSGNTEETLSAFEQAIANSCRCLVLTTGGSLAAFGQAQEVPVWRYTFTAQPRAAIGWIFGLLLAALYRLGLLPDPAVDLQQAVEALEAQQAHLLPEVPTAANPAKRMAGQMVGRSVILLAADDLVPVARRWKGQINESAKAWAQCEDLPEADHNTLAGLNNPEPVLMQSIALFLESSDNHPRNRLRLDYTRQIFMTQAVNTDTIRAAGIGRMAHIWTLLHFGDYTSYYLAMAYGEDPTPVEIIAALKDELGRATL